jgi:hypothetical protein
MNEKREYLCLPIPSVMKKQYDPDKEYSTALVVQVRSWNISTKSRKSSIW